MIPSLYPGDLITVDGGLPLPGEIAVVEHENRWISHRVVSITDQTIELRGDNLASEENHFFSKEALIGRVISQHRDQRSYLIRLLYLGAQNSPESIKIILRKILPSKAFAAFKKIYTI